MDLRIDLSVQILTRQSSLVRLHKYVVFKVLNKQKKIGRKCKIKAELLIKVLKNQIEMNIVKR